MGRSRRSRWCHRYEVRQNFRRIAWVFAIIAFVAFWFCLPEPLFRKTHSTVLYSAEGQLLSAITASDGQWRFPERSDVPPRFAAALLEFEDRQFYNHSGVYIPSILGAIRENMSRGRAVRGGSTLTMQVIRISRNNPPRTVWRKMLEAIQALRLEWRYTKKEILGLYASHAPFGGNVVGLDAAAWRYFGHPAEELSWAESATLAVLPNAPSLIFPGKNQEKLQAKRDRLLMRLFETNHIDEETLQLALLEPLPGRPYTLPMEAPHLLHTLIRQHGKGKTFRTTIRYSLQIAATQALQQHIDLFEPSHVHNAAALIVEAGTGNVLAYVGNSRDAGNRYANMVDVIPARRSSGSILKPFLYASMLDDGLILPHSLVADIPVQFEGFAPRNYSLTFDGAVPASRALARSLNVPSVIMLQEYGYERFYHKLKKLGFSHLSKPAGHYGLSIILGGAEASLWDICRAYAGMSRTLVRFGNYGEYKQDEYLNQYVLIEENQRSFSGSGNKPQKPDRYPPLSAGAIYSTFTSLLEVNRPESELGWESYASTAPIAWKTGTSFGNRDAWAVGTTPGYVIGVWVGNATGEGRPELTGVHAAAPLLFRLFSLLKEHTWFVPPVAEQRAVEVCLESGMLVGANCPSIEKAIVPGRGSESAPCAFHQLIHLNREGTHRVTDQCHSPSDMVSRPWFVLPGVQEYYYRKKHPEYKVLPGFLEGCDPLEQTPISFIYPKSSSPVFIPRNVSGVRERVVLKAAHRNRDAILYWHINEEYLGESKIIHEMEITPDPGIYRITLVDDKGNSAEQSIKVISR